MKTGHASEQQRPDVLARRQAWFDGQIDLDPDKLIFIDEPGASTKMARLRGWAPKGERCRATIPHGHWQTTTFTAELRIGGFAAPWLLDGPMYGEAFLAYARRVLAPELAPGDFVIMDNRLAEPQSLASRHRAGGRPLSHRQRRRPETTAAKFWRPLFLDSQLSEAEFSRSARF